MYWNEAHSPQIEILLSNEDLKLTDLLNNDDVLQQCKGQNKTLVAYLLRLDVLEELIDLITKEPPEDVNESLRFKYPNIACEVLTSDLPALKERIVAQHNLLDKLFSFLEQDPPLNPLLTSFFTKTFGMLFAQGGEQNWFTYQCTCIQLLGFIKSRNGFLDNIYKHLGLRVIVDLLFSIITNVSADDIKGDLYTWLNEQKLIENLIGILGQDDKSYKNNNIAQFLSELIKWGRTHRQTVLQEVGSYNATCYSDPLLQLLESEQCTELLLQKMLSSSNTQSYSTIESGINILLTILDNPIINQPVSDIALQTLIEFEKEHHRRIIGNVLKAIVPYVSDFHNILINPTNKPDIKTTIAAISPPFGNVRLQVCTLLTVLIETGYPDIIKLICETEFYNTLLKLFKQYCWNNILHNLVKRCFTFVFPPPPPPPPIKVDVDVVIDSQNESIIDGGPSTVVTNPTTITEPTITTTKITDIQNHLIVNCKIVPKFIDCWMHNNTIQFEQKRPRLGYMGHLIEMFNLLVCQLSSSDDLRALIETNLNDEELKNWNIIANLNDGELMNEIGKQKTLLANIDLNAVDTTEVVPVEENPDDSIQNTADIDDGNDDYVCEQFEEACEQNSNDYNMDMAAEEWMDSDSLSSNKLPYNLAPYVSNYLNGSDMNDINNSSHHHHHHNPFETKGFNATTNDFDNYSTDNFSSDNFADFDTYFNTYGNPFDDNDNNNNNNNNHHHDNDPFSNVNHFKNNNNNDNNFELTQSADDYNKLNDKLLPPTFEHNENNVILNNNHNHNAIDSRDTNSKFNNIDVNALWESIKETNNKSDTKSYNNNNNNSNTSTIADDDVFKIENHLAMLNFDNSIDFSTNNEHHLNDTNNKNHSVQENIFSNNIENFVPSSLNNNHNNNNHDNNINDIDVKIKTDTSDKLSDVIINNNVQIHNNNNNINLESNLDDKNNDNDEIDGGKKYIIQNENDYENKLSSVHKSGQYINEGSSDAVLLLPANAKLIITSSCNNGSVNNNREDDVHNPTTTIMAAGITDTTTFITSSNQDILKKNDNDQIITKNIINTIGSCDDNNLSCASDVTIPSSSSSSSSSTEITNDLTAATAASTTDNSTIND